MLVPARTVGNCVCGWRNDYQKTAAEERKVCAERQRVKVSQEAVNGPIKSTRMNTPPQGGQCHKRPWPTSINQVLGNLGHVREGKSCYLLTKATELYAHQVEPGTPWGTSPTLPRSHWCASAVVHFWVNNRRCPFSSSSHCMTVSEHLPELCEATSDFTVQIVTAINNSFITTQFTKGVLRNTGFDLCLPQLCPWSGKREFTTYSQWSNRVNHLMVSDSHIFEKLIWLFYHYRNYMELFQEVFLQGFIINMSGKLPELGYVNKMFNSN